MIYRTLTNPKHSAKLKVLTLFVLLSFSITISSCVTYYTNDITPQEYESLSNPESETISKIETRDSIINAATYTIWYKRAESAFVLNKIDSILVSTSGPLAYRLHNTVTKLKLSDTYKITTSHSKFDFGKTMMWTGIAVGTFLVILVIAAILSPPKMMGTIKFN